MVLLIIMIIVVMRVMITMVMIIYMHKNVTMETISAALVLSSHPGNYGNVIQISSERRSGSSEPARVHHSFWQRKS